MERRNLLKSALGIVGGFFVLPKKLQAELKTVKDIGNNKYCIKAKYSLDKKIIGSFNQGFRLIEQHDLVVNSVILHTDTLQKILPSIDQDIFISYPVLNVPVHAILEQIYKEKYGKKIPQDIKFRSENRCWGHLWTSDIILSSQCPKDSMYLTNVWDNFKGKPNVIDFIKNNKVGVTGKDVIVRIDFE